MESKKNFYLAIAMVVMTTYAGLQIHAAAVTSWVDYGIFAILAMASSYFLYEVFIGPFRGYFDHDGSLLDDIDTPESSESQSPKEVG
jgi:hypothetical protein